MRKKTRQIRYKLADLFKGTLFGHEEIMQGYKRRCRVRCLTNCSLIYLNRDQHKRWAPDRWKPAQIEMVNKNMRILDLDYIVEKISRYNNEKTRLNIAVLDSAKLNCHDLLGLRSNYLHNNENKNQMSKLMPWINKAR